MDIIFDMRDSEHAQRNSWVWSLAWSWVDDAWSTWNYDNAGYPGTTGKYTTPSDNGDGIEMTDSWRERKRLVDEEERWERETRILQNRVLNEELLNVYDTNPQWKWPWKHFCVEEDEERDITDITIWTRNVEVNIDLHRVMSPMRKRIMALPDKAYEKREMLRQLRRRNYYQWTVNPGNGGKKKKTRLYVEESEIMEGHTYVASSVKKVENKDEQYWRTA